MVKSKDGAGRVLNRGFTGNLGQAVVALNQQKKADQHKKAAPKRRLRRMSKCDAMAKLSEASAGRRRRKSLDSTPTSKNLAEASAPTVAAEPSKSRWRRKALDESSSTTKSEGTEPEVQVEASSSTSLQKTKGRSLFRCISKKEMQEGTSEASSEVASKSLCKQKTARKLSDSITPNAMVTAAAAAGETC